MHFSGFSVFTQRDIYSLLSLLVRVKKLFYLLFPCVNVICWSSEEGKAINIIGYNHLELKML